MRFDLSVIIDDKKLFNTNIVFKGMVGLNTCLTLNAPITTKVVCFSCLLKCLRSLYGKQCGPRSGAVCSGSMLFDSILNSSVMLGNYLQQKTSADDIFLSVLRVNFPFASLRILILLKKF